MGDYRRMGTARANKKHRILDLNSKMNERGLRIIERFGSEAVSGVNHPELLKVLREVTGYMKDTFRPALTSFCCEAVGGKPEIADDAALLFTLAAAGTSIHDDIIDNQLGKRFRKTVFGSHGLDMALLVGDLLIFRAWSMLQEIIRKINQPAKVAEIIESYRISSTKICEGELKEISCRRKLDTDLEDCQRILRDVNLDLETRARVGVILGSGSEVEKEALSEVGKRLALLLGLKDDTLDSRGLLGNLSHRIMYESVPLPILFAAQSSRKWYLRIESILKKQHISSPDTGQLLQICCESEAFSYIRDLAKNNAKEAKEKLQILKPSAARDVLDFMVKKSFDTIDRLCF
jgi:geranylgeranyl pyrophosphate synthase